MDQAEAMIEKEMKYDLNLLEDIEQMTKLAHLFKNESENQNTKILLKSEIEKQL